MPQDLYPDPAPSLGLRLLRPLAGSPFATAIGVAAAILMLTIVIVDVVRTDQVRQGEMATASRVDFVAARVEAHVRTRVSLGRLVRQEWRDGLIDGRAAFARQAASKLQQFSDLQAISWVDPQGVIRWVNPLAGNEAAQDLDVTQLTEPSEALARARRTGKLVLSPPITLTQGGSGFVAYLPIAEAGAADGYINIVFRAEALFDEVLTPRLTNGYRLTISDGDMPLYSTGRVTSADTAYAAMDLPIRNRVWRIEAAPRADMIAEGETLFDEAFLVFGLLAALVTATMIYLALASHNRLRSQRQRLSDYAAVSSDYFWEMDADLRFSYLSERFEEVTGIPPSALLGRTRAEVGAPGSTPEAFELHLTQLANHEPFRDFVHTRERGDGEIVFLAISGKPAYDAHGAFIGYRGIGRDITHQKRNEEALNEALQDAERASQAKSDFLATMSHEFRTPLNAIIGFSDILGNEWFGPLGSDRYRAYAQDIQGSGLHMLALVNDVLDLAKLESGNRPLEIESVPLDEFLPGCLRPFIDQARRKGVRLDLSAPEGLPLLDADPRALTQIVYNLLSNAIKYTPDGGTVTLSAAADAKDRTIRLSVVDTGTGISPESLARIMEPFVQDRAHPHLSQEGSGLGLSIVRSLVEAHGGHFTIDSTEGDGTTAVVCFPWNGESLEAGDKAGEGGSRSDDVETAADSATGAA